MYCAQDYRLLSQAGVFTVRDGLRWHLIENTPGVYDWSSFLPMLEAAHLAGTQVIWDLCHWGVPDHLDVFSAEFIDRFAAFAGAAASLIRAFNLQHAIALPPVYSPINEISFWSWVGGDVEHFHPYGQNRGTELKRQLVQASIAAMRAVLAADPAARFVQPEPIIHISAAPAHQEDTKTASMHTEAQFEAWDMLAGLRSPELGGTPELLDVVGVNYYWNNQWVHGGERTPPGHFLHRPLHELLLFINERYHRPILITETGAESNASCGWLGYIAAEVRQAQRSGADVIGICLYPIMDYPGWDDDRHCLCGLIGVDDAWSGRYVRPDLCGEMRAQAALFHAVPGQQEFTLGSGKPDDLSR